MKRKDVPVSQEAEMKGKKKRQRRSELWIDPMNFPADEVMEKTLTRLCRHYEEIGKEEG